MHIITLLVPWEEKAGFVYRALQIYLFHFYSTYSSPDPVFQKELSPKFSEILEEAFITYKKTWKNLDPKFLSHCLLVRGQQWKHQNNEWNLFEVNNKEIKKVLDEVNGWKPLTILTTLFIWHLSVFIVSFEQISHIDLVFPLLTLNKFSLSYFVEILYLCKKLSQKEHYIPSM